MSRQPSHNDVVFPPLHLGNGDVTTPRDLQVAARRRHYMDSDSDHVTMTSRALALRVSDQQDVMKCQCGSCSRQPGITWSTMTDSEAKHLLQQRLRTVTDVIHKLSHDVQVCH